MTPCYINKDKNETSLTMPGKILFKLKDVWDIIEAVAQSRKEWSFRLEGDFFFRTHMFQKKRWVSFLKKRGEGEGKSFMKGNMVTIPYKDFQLIQLKLEEMINILDLNVEGGGRVRRQLFLPRPIGTIFHCDVLRSDGTPLFTTLHGELCAELAREGGEKWVEEHNLEGVILKVTKAPILPFPSRDLMKVVWLDTVFKLCSQRAREQCEGCYFDSPAQKDHMEGGGCLSTLEEKIGVHYGHIACDIYSQELLQSFDRLNAKLGLGPKMGGELAKAIPDWLGRDGAMEALSTKWVEQEKIKSLFRLQTHISKFD